jgi:hypothetical protein
METPEHLLRLKVFDGLCPAIEDPSLAGCLRPGPTRLLKFSSKDSSICLNVDEWFQVLSTFGDIM